MGFFHAKGNIEAKVIKVKPTGNNKNDKGINSIGSGRLDFENPEITTKIKLCAHNIVDVLHPFIR